MFGSFFSRPSSPNTSSPTPHTTSAPSPPKNNWLTSLRRTVTRASLHSSPSLAEPATTSSLAARLIPYRPPRGVVPQHYTPPHTSNAAHNPSQIATDAAPNTMVDMTNWAITQAAPQPSWVADGIGFLGYPTLAQMAQRAEFRKPCDVIAREATREWITLTSTPQEAGTALSPSIPEDKTTRLHALKAEIKRLNIRDIIHQQVLDSLLYGIGHIWLDIKDTPKTIFGQNIPLPLTPNGVKKGSLSSLKIIEPVWTTPNSYNADSPLRDDYYRPQNWWVQGCLIHKDRLLSMIPYGVSDLFKPAFNFGGMSLTQQLRPYVHNFLRTRNSVSNITANFSKLVLKTDMAGLMATGENDIADPATSITGRASFMQQISEGQDVIIADHQSEDISIIATPLTGLADLQAHAMEAMASIPGIPLVKLFGITPNGLNASSEGEIRVFYDEIAAFQEAHMRPILTKLLTLAQLNLWGATDPTLDFQFNPLWQLDTKTAAHAAANFAKAQAHSNATQKTT